MIIMDRRETLYFALKFNQPAMDTTVISNQELNQLRQDTAGTANVIHFNNAGASLPPDVVVDTVVDYLKEEALAGGWFVTGRKRRFKANVSFDGRLVDTIYVHDPHRPGAVYKCKMTPRSDRYVGLSFNEVKALEKFQRMLAPSLRHSKIQVIADFHGSTEPIIDNALKKLKSADLKVSRTARRADTKAARIDELRTERQELAPGLNPTPSATPAKVISFSTERATHAKSTTAVGGTSPRSEAPGTQTCAPVANTPSSAQEKLSLMKQRMLRG